MLAWLGLCAPAHLCSRALGRSLWPRRFLRGVRWIVGVRVQCVGRTVEPHTLLLANHLSWLDIPLLADVTGCAFVSKDELRGNWLMRWLCQQHGTVFVDRSDRRGIAEQAAAMVRALERDQPLTLFAEGTVGDGGPPLPFRPALLSAFTPPPPDTAIRPVAVDYGLAARDLAWPQGESGTANFLRIIARRGTVPVTVHLLPPLPRLGDRKELAREAHDAVTDALAASGIRRAAV